MSFAIQSFGLSKKFRRGLRASADTAVLAALRGLFDLTRAKSKSAADEFWALENASFSIPTGESVGLIGRNGAGKSTLLKLLARVLEPTAGRATIRGRVNSLLEVGVGFSADLTGRENIYLNGAILGMSNADLRTRFDAIVDFAEIGAFIDTPVKRYSSGMYMRLAFAVAAHLEPDILLVDEVLAVGDAKFQKKCLGRLDNISSEGRTVVFVSHNIQAITRLCKRGILLEKGRVVAEGPILDVAAKYMNAEKGQLSKRTWSVDTTSLNKPVRLLSAEVTGPRLNESQMYALGSDLEIALVYEVRQPMANLMPNVHFFAAEGGCAFVAGDESRLGQITSPGIYITRLHLPANLLNEGQYSLDVALSSFEPLEVHVHERDALSILMAEPPSASRLREYYGQEIPGAVRPRFAWRTEQLA